MKDISQAMVDDSSESILAFKKQNELIIKQNTYLKQLHKELKGKSCDVIQTAERAFQAVVIFTQHEGGSGVCISEDGLILTCAHCVYDVDDEKDEINIRTTGIGINKTILFTSGDLCHTECIAWDPIRDCALLKIISSSSRTKVFQFISILKSTAKSHLLLCIGQPGRDDLESKTLKKTNYPLVYTSLGRFRGYLHGGKKLQNNSEIGQLKHNCWTYWGHSGAPLITQQGKLFGLHSSWDDKTTMRHGIPLVAIENFLKDFKNLEKN
ncbi:unnamed protein product [Didymodactylos carnosus]|uniref:Uncharacterized protein n=1 Tax=Didymodactylos carnosus TaxID=1234261 RepID=A0A814P3Y3_9BILA|nr:unnamed protein product [Didymodactylos carnosus]CAF1301538.1 unnamed protein product [Didymodactylos carnosus]CAF3867300.1 unnamed protein product [Didymodactylos carnosus]CAF4107891.1 unnamed protein product [Didymodactylos carnosus]